MPTLSVVNFNVVCATLGGFITMFGLISYLLKEKFYLSEALISLLAGLVVSPHATGWINPLEYALGNEENLETITLYFTRLVLGVQLVLAGVQLPRKYLKKEWRSLSLLLGPGMCAMWISTSLLVWGLVPNIDFLFALAVGACVTPTDPVLSNGIVKESGANDGLGYPFLFLALYLIKYTGNNGLGQPGGAGKAMGYWFGETWAYVIILSVVYGAVVGYIAKELLHWAEQRRYVDRESFLVFAITLALFIVGTVGMIGSDDVLACFIAGNVFTWDDWFRLETMDDSLQPTIDMLLNVSIFMWFGAVCPWHKFVVNDVIPIYRLIPLGILVLLLRRLPIVLAMHHKIHQIEHMKQAVFVGFFGPIGVSAIFYLYVSREFLREIYLPDGITIREDAVRLADVMDVVIWFLAMCSIVVHGLTIPLGKLGFYLPRTITTAISSEQVSASTSRDLDEPEPLHIREHVRDEERALSRFFHRRPETEDQRPGTMATSRSDGGNSFTRPLSRIGKKIVSDLNRPHGTSAHGKDRHDAPNNGATDGETQAHKEISAPQNPRLIGKAIQGAPVSGRRTVREARAEQEGNGKDGSSAVSPVRSGATTPQGNVPMVFQRSIRFPDEESAPITSKAASPNEGLNPTAESPVPGRRESPKEYGSGSSKEDSKEGSRRES